MKFSEEHCSNIGLSKRGENNHNTKFTEEDVLEILQLINAGIPLKEIAEKFDVKPSVITGIKTGKTWSWLTKIEYKSSLKLTDKTVLEIVDLINKGEHGTEIAKKYNIAPVTVNAIKKGRIWKKVTQGKFLEDINTMEGENHPLHKLTKEQVIELYKRAWNNESQSDLAKEFNIKQSVVSRIKTGKRWGHLTSTINLAPTI
jgi:predicted DNA-binding protein YlxM (UPF0122 family)